MPSGSSRMRSTICCGVWRWRRVPSFGAVLHADAGVQQAEVVVDLGDRADGGAGVAAGRLLVDRDRRREAVDVVDVGLVHLPQELAGVGAQALHVAALALGVDRVEGEAALAGAGQTGEDDQPVARQLDVDVAQVVLAGAADDDAFGGGRGGAGTHRFDDIDPRNTADSGSEAVWITTESYTRSVCRARIVRTPVRGRCPFGQSSPLRVTDRTDAASVVDIDQRRSGRSRDCAVRHDSVQLTRSRRRPRHLVWRPSPGAAAGPDRKDPIT